jgi:hypothetical protein
MRAAANQKYEKILQFVEISFCRHCFNNAFLIICSTKFFEKTVRVG